MTTKLQPANIDQTLDYSVDQLSANTVVVSGVDVLSYAQSAFLQANTVYNVANTLSPEDTFARTTANAAFIQANAAFAKANTGANTSLVVSGRAGSVIISIVSGIFTIYGRAANTLISVS